MILGGIKFLTKSIKVSAVVIFLFSEVVCWPLSFPTPGWIIATIMIPSIIADYSEKIRVLL